MKLVMFDLETGGVDDAHPDIQLAAVAVDGTWHELEHFEAKIKFDVASADPEALKMNSWNPEAWAIDSLPEANVVRAFGQFLARHVDLSLTSKRTGRPYKVARLAGHNVARFDAPRLLRMFQRHKAFLPADTYRPLDTMQLALWSAFRAGETLPSFRLEDVAKWVGVRTDGAHDALQDVRMCVQIARELQGVRA